MPGHSTFTSFCHKLLFTACLCLGFSIARAQQESDIAKLNDKLAKAKTDIEKIDVLTELGNAYAYGNNDSLKVWHYADLLMTMANKADNHMGRGTSCYLKGIYFLRKRQFNRAIGLFQQSAVYSRLAKHTMNHGNAYFAIAQCYGYLGQPENAIEAYKQARDIYATQAKLAQLLINTDLILYRLNEARNNYDASLTYLFDALKTSEAMPSKYRYTEILIDLGNSYWRLKQYEKAKSHYQMVIAYAQQTKNNIEIGNGYAGLGLVYLDEANYPEAKKFTEKALEILRNYPLESARLNTVYNNLGGINLRLGHYEEAIVYLKKSLDYTEKTKDVSATIVSQANIGYAYAQLKKFEEADKWFELVKKANLSAAYPYALSNLYAHLANLDSLKGDFKNALDHKNLYYTYDQKDANLKVSQQLNQLNALYETEKKEAQITLLNKEKSIDLLKLSNQTLQLAKKEQALQINQLEINSQHQQLISQTLSAKEKEQDIKYLKKQNQIQHLELRNKALQIKQRNLILIGLLLLFTVLALLGFSVYKRHKIKLQNEIYQQQELATKALFEGEQQERIRIARDLHDSIGQMLSVVKMNLSNLQHQQPENAVADRTAQLVDHAIDEVRHISHNLIPEELNFGLFNAIEELCDKISAGGTLTTLKVPNHIKNYPFSKQNELSIYRIVQEVLHNMVKHAQATKIEIDVVDKVQSFSIAIRDNGQGFDPKSLKQSKGIGWKNISARVNLLNGRLRIHSERLSGTQIEITLPSS